MSVNFVILPEGYRDDVNPEGVKNLRPQGGRPFAEFTLSEANVLRVT